MTGLGRRLGLVPGSKPPPMSSSEMAHSAWPLAVQALKMRFDLVDRGARAMVVEHGPLATVISAELPQTKLIGDPGAGCTTPPVGSASSRSG